jgi:hypothetical protein
MSGFCEHVRAGNVCIFCDDGYVLCWYGCGRDATHELVTGMLGSSWFSELVCEACYGLVTEVDNLLSTN